MIKTLTITGLIIVITLFILYLFQRHLMYFPAKESPNRELFQATDMQDIQLHTQDGLTLMSWYKPARSVNLPTILYLHGNAGHIGYRMSLTRELLDAGYGVLLLEYRGYGGNSGQPTEQGLYWDGEAALAYLKQQGVPANKIIFYGESLGTGVATFLAEKNPVCALILQSPYMSMTALAKHHYPWFLLAPWDTFDSLAKIDKIHTPLLILHGQLDTLVPFSHAETLFKKANEPKQLTPFPSKGHNNLWSNEFLTPIFQFISKHCVSS